VFVVQDEFNTDLCLNGMNVDFLDNILLDSDGVTAANNTDFGRLDCTATDPHRTDHMYSQSYRDLASDSQPSVSPPSVGSHASLYSHSTGSPLADVNGLETSSSASPTEVCASPLDYTTEDLTMQGMLTVVEPTTMMLQGNDIIHVITGDETDDSGLITVGMLPLLCAVNSIIKMLFWL